MNPRSRSLLSLQPLESRLAPAVTIVDSHTATFTDIDGDKVTVKISKGTLDPGRFTTVLKGHGDQLQAINFAGGGFDGTDLTITATRMPAGDGQVNVGLVNSFSHDLGKVRIAGDLGRIRAGDVDPAAPAVVSLSVRSMGRYGLDTQLPGGSLESDFLGGLGKLIVTGDVVGAYVRALESPISFWAGTIGSVTIGGSLIGGVGNISGVIVSEGDMGPVRIGHDVIGGSGQRSGWIESPRKMAGVTVGGSLIGGANWNSGGIHSSLDMGPVRIGHNVIGGAGVLSGVIKSDSGNLARVTVGGSLIGGESTSGIIESAGDIGLVQVGHDLKGGTGASSGLIVANGKLAGATVGGSVVGGSGDFSGIIYGFGDMGPVRVRDDVVGGSISGTAPALNWSGVILGGGRIASVSVGGSVISGIDASTTGSLTYNASIRTGDDIGSLTVRGSLSGNSNPNGDSPVIISARGQGVLAPGATTDVAIGRVTIGGRVENARILAGYNTTLDPVNADAQIGAVTVGGDWIASSLVAGVRNAVSENTKFGDGNDAAIAGGNTAIDSRIASITIKGLVYGTPASVSATDHYGFVAQQIGTFRAGGLIVSLHSGPGMDVFALAPVTGDVTIREVA